MTDPRDASGDDGRPPRPMGLSLLIWLFGFWAGAIALVFLGFLIGDGPVMLSGRALPRHQALLAVTPVLLPMGLAVVGAAFALALDRAWARPAALLPFAIAALAPLFPGGGSPVDAIAGTLLLVPVAIALGCYLYCTAGVRSYYAALRREP